MILAAFGFPMVCQSQVTKEYILKNTNVDELHSLAEEYAAVLQAERDKALVVAKRKGWPTENLIRISKNGHPEYQAPTNLAASGLTNTDDTRSGFNVSGSEMIIGMWEALVGGNYAARATHQDLIGRVTILDGNTTPSSHGSHVAGTLIGSPPIGVGIESTGMAPSATLRSRNGNTDLVSMATEAAGGLLISNHSYGTIAGWEYEESNDCIFGGKKWTWKGDPAQFNSSGDDSNFGIYNWQAREYDQICHNAPFFLPIKAAGNNGSDNPDEGITCADDVRNGDNGTYVDYDLAIHPLGDGNQRSCISTYGNAKNILTIGNLKGDLTINASSSKGLTDDGRIKPDLCGIGTDLYSAESNADNAYGTKTGTSMAAPNVAGSLLLLQELYEDHAGNGVYMRSASVKGLAIHSATDLYLPGPDATTGWGLLNAHMAGTIIERSFLSLEHRILEEPGPSAGAVYSFYNDGTSDLKVTLCYTDPPGTASSSHNDPNLKLVNDLDLVVTKVGGSSSLPYLLDNNNPWAAATSGDNDRDNVEQVYWANPDEGTYEVYVNVEGTLSGTQPFSIIVSGIDCPDNGTITHSGGDIPSDDYYANIINANGNVQSGSTVNYKAVTDIHLTNGFNAYPGSNFNAKIFGCD